MISTLKSELKSAEICERNGWGPGTVLRGEKLHPRDETPAPVIQITALGLRYIMAFDVAAGPASEDRYDLHTREWRPVDTFPIRRRCQRDGEGRRHVSEED